MDRRSNPMGDTRGVGLTAFLFLLLALPFWAAGAEPADEDANRPERFAVLLEVDGAIGPATTDYLTRSFKKAAEEGAEIVVVRMDTPGGLDAATRDIVQEILDSPVPIALYVAPEGARAASAGTYILYASHIAAMAPATTLGAATPIQMGGGGSMPSGPSEQKGGESSNPESSNGDDQKPKSPSPQDTMSQKMINDAAAFIRGLAEKRGRNAEWAELAVRKAATLTSLEALEQNVIEYLVDDVDALLADAHGGTVDVQGRTVTLDTEGIEVRERKPDWRSQLLALITNPTVAYLLMMLGIYGLIFEGSNPGALVPGVVGAICILLALFAFQILPINYAGLLLIGLGIALMVVEAFMPSFGVLGIGGLISLIVGSIILMDTDVPGFGISPFLIGTVAAITGTAFLLILVLALRSWGRPIQMGREELTGSTAEAWEDFDERGWVHVKGETWQARSESPVKKGQALEITRTEGLTVFVRPKDEARKE